MSDAIRTPDVRVRKLDATPKSSHGRLGSWFANRGGQRSGQLNGQLCCPDARRSLAGLSGILACATDGVGGKVHEFGGLLVGGSGAPFVDRHQRVLALVLLWQQRCERAGAVGPE
jgi:hypothetical protein